MTYAEELHARQFKFMHNLANLIHFIGDSGYNVSGGELWRSEETQAAHVKAGRSKTLNSMHLKRLAIDLNIFDGEYLLFSDSERKQKDFRVVEQFGEQWEGYDKDNVWGGRWTEPFDPFHFQQTF